MTISVLSQTPGYIVDIEYGSEGIHINEVIVEMRGHCRVLEVRGPHIADTLHAAKQRYFKEDLERGKTRVVIFLHRDHAESFSKKMEGLGCIIDFS